MPPTDRVWLPKGAMKDRELRDLRQREPRLVESAYKGFIAGLPCVACFRHGVINKRKVVVAHVRMAISDAGWRETGMQEKPDDRRTVPLCDDHHRDNSPIGQHRVGERNFWPQLGINPAELCHALSDAFDNNQAGMPVIARFAAQGRKNPWICVSES